jgi:molecular chaperone GrpE
MNDEVEKDREDNSPEESFDDLVVGGPASIEAQLEEVLREKEQFMRLAQRSQADLVNYRSRVRVEQEELQSRTAQRVALRFVEIVDLFERALSPSVAEGVDASWLEGMKAIYQQFLNTLAQEGFERFNAEGEEFDPHRHDALLSTPTDKHRPNTVIRQLSAGYTRHGQVVRPAQVEIAAPLASPAGEEDNNE